MQDFINEAGSESRLTDGDVNGSSNEEQEIRFEQLPFDHPLYIMFSSGTTGKPKCIVHSVGGTLIQHLKEHQLHFNVSRDDVMLFYTTTGWMMWNWAISCLALGCPVVCYDGSPFSPSDDVVWDLVDSLGVTLLGVSPKMLTMMETKGVSPKKTHKLTSLRAIFSTGSPLAPKSFNYVYTDVKQDVLLSSITGGTDIISLFGAGSVSLPVYRGQIQCRGLGMAVECFNEEGVPTRNEPGELVCTKPFPCMPIGFWNDKDGEKYRQAYFSVYPHVWAHGDFCMITTKPPGIVMMGRSDGTLNPSGVRFGSSDIYNIVETLPEVEDSLCVGQMNSDGEERVILFLKLTEGSQLSNELVCKVKGAIRFQLTPRHVPAVIMEAPDIPYTVNSKKVEVAVKKIISGHHLEEEATAGLANPEALNFFNHLPDLQQWLESPVPNGH
jgi:acetoacetyl-CoA synthetase